MKKITAILLSLVLLAGCSASRERFYQDPTRPDVTSLCRAITETTDIEFATDVANELVRRGITADDCRNNIQAQNVAIGAIAIAGVAMVGIAAARSGGGLGGGTYVPPRPYGYAWDQFRNEYGQLVWYCRDRSNGRFADNYRCTGLKVDSTWPGPYYVAGGA